MTKGQKSLRAERRQEQVENPMALLGAALVRLEHDSLRVRQAIRRAGLEDLLEQVLRDHGVIEEDIRKVQGYLREIWDDGQKKQWKK